MTSKQIENERRLGTTGLFWNHDTGGYVELCRKEEFMKLELHIPVPLKVTIDEARDKMRLLIVSLAKENGVTGLKEAWVGYTDTFAFTMKGYQIHGHMTVGHNTIDVVAELPWVAGIFKGKISDDISEKARRLLG